MGTTQATTYNEMLQQYADEYFAETGQETATTREMAAWAIKTGRWEAPTDLLIQKCREDFATALRDQYLNDENGSPVRAKQVARIVRDGVQQFLWGDIRKVSRKHMQSAVQLKREQMVGECRQIDRDCSFWNKLHPAQPPIQCVFNFMADVEEGRFSGNFTPPNQPR